MSSLALSAASIVQSVGGYRPDELLCLRDIGGRILSVNAAWERLLDYPLAEIADRPLIELVHPEDRDATCRTMSLVNDRHRAVSFRNRYRARDGQYRTLEWRAARSGELVVGIARAITV